MSIREIAPQLGRPILLAAALMLWSATAIQAQAQEADGPPPAKGRHTWLNIGIAGSPEGLGMVGSVSFEAVAPLLITVRGLNVTEMQLCLYGPCTTPADQLYELAVLPGVMAQSRSVIASLSAGVGVLWRKESESPTVTEIGLPVELQLYLLPTRSVGFGVTGLANFNRGAPFWAGVVGVQIGL